MKLSSTREGGKGFFLDLFISQVLGGNQEQTSITSAEERVEAVELLADLEALSEE